MSQEQAAPQEKGLRDRGAGRDPHLLVPPQCAPDSRDFQGDRETRAGGPSSEVQIHGPVRWGARPRSGTPRRGAHGARQSSARLRARPHRRPGPGTAAADPCPPWPRVAGGPRRFRRAEASGRDPFSAALQKRPFSFVWLLSLSSLPKFLRVDQDKDKDCQLACAGAAQKPLCASDGRTFLSRCDFQRAKCKDPQLEIAHRGGCRGERRAGGGGGPAWPGRP